MWQVLTLYAKQNLVPGQHNARVHRLKEQEEAGGGRGEGGGERGGDEGLKEHDSRFC